MEAFLVCTPNIEAGNDRLVRRTRFWPHNIAKPKLSSKRLFLLFQDCSERYRDSRVKSRFPYWESDFKMRKTAFTNTHDAGVY